MPLPRPAGGLRSQNSQGFSGGFDRGICNPVLRFTIPEYRFVGDLDNCAPAGAEPFGDRVEAACGVPADVGGIMPHAGTEIDQLCVGAHIDKTCLGVRSGEQIIAWAAALLLMRRSRRTAPISSLHWRKS